MRSEFIFYRLGGEIILVLRHPHDFQKTRLKEDSVDEAIKEFEKYRP